MTWPSNRLTTRQVLDRTNETLTCLYTDAQTAVQMNFPAGFADDL